MLYMPKASVMSCMCIQNCAWRHQKPQELSKAACECIATMLLLLCVAVHDVITGAAVVMQIYNFAPA